MKENKVIIQVGKIHKIPNLRKYTARLVWSTGPGVNHECNIIGTTKESCQFKVDEEVAKINKNK